MSSSIRFWGSNGFGPNKSNPFKILENDTRKTIIAWLNHHPMTATQIADGLGLSQPTIFEHIQLLIETGLVKEVDIPEKEKPFKTEKYYIPAFPIISDRDKLIVKPICEKIGEELRQAFLRHEGELKEALETTPLGQKGFSLRELWGWIRMLFLQSAFKEQPPSWSSGARFYFYGEITSKEKSLHGLDRIEASLDVASTKLERGLEKTRRQLDSVRESLGTAREGLSSLPPFRRSPPLPPLPGKRTGGLQRLWNEAFGEGYIHPLPPKGKIGWGTGLHKTREGVALGFDWDKLQIVTDQGTMRLPSRKRTYTDRERRIMQIALRELKDMRVEARGRMLARKIRRALKKSLDQRNKG